MGRGSYTAADWNRLSNSRGLQKQTSHREIFTGKTAYSMYRSDCISDRQSRDSEESPAATPVLIGFDNTASMGYLAKALAKDGLHRTVAMLYGTRSITNPHVLCAAVGDSKSDRFPLQVTQFEADVRILSQLLDLHLEGGGGGNGGESYHLLWYFAAHHTRTDAYDKRREKGFLFTIGNDRCHASLTPLEIEDVFHDRVNYPMSNEELLQEVLPKYEVFHIHIRDPHQEDGGMYRAWQTILPGRVAVITPDQVSLLPLLILSLIRLAKGETTAQALAGMDPAVSVPLSEALAGVEIVSKPENLLTF